MPHLIVYLLKANAALCLFYLAYRLLLRRLTFYYLNRIFLVFGIVFSSAYPFIDLSWLFIKHEVLSRQLIVIVPNWQAIVPTATPEHTTFDYWQIPVVLFWIGVILMTVRLIVQLISIYKIHTNSSIADYNGQVFKSVKNDINPFSFWQAIYLNPDKHQDHELQAIIEHEQIHVKQWHTLDVLLAELSTVFYWFNPGVWLMKQAIKENLEFITDRKILQSGIDEKVYQYSLVRVSNLKQSAAIVNNFNFLTIKKRIMMMNKKRSSKAQVSRYIILLPLVIVLALAFTVSKAALSPKSISAFVKRILPKAIVNNDERRPASSVIDLQKNTSTAIDTAKKLEKADTAYLKGDKQDAIISATYSTVADARNHLITLYNERKPISASDILSYVLKATNTKLPSASDDVDMKNALYIYASGKDLIYSDSYAKVSGLNPSKIDSVAILNSSDAIALYGYRAKDGAVIIKLKPAVVGDVLQLNDTKTSSNSDSNIYFNSGTVKSYTSYSTHSKLDTAYDITADKRNQVKITGIVTTYPSTGGPAHYELHKDAQTIDPNTNVNNDQEINCIIIPDGVQKNDFKEVIKLFKNNGFVLNIKKEYKGDSLDLLKISLASADKTAASATYRIKELADSHYYISIKANKVTNQLSIQSVKGN